MRSILTLLVLVLGIGFVNAQTLEELKAKKAAVEAQAAPVQAQADALKAEIEGIDAAIAKLPGWYKGASGIIGANFAGRSNWFAAGDLKNSTATTISGNFTAYANNIQDAYFWRNGASLSLGWQKLKLGTEAAGTEAPKFQNVADVLNISSLFGYNITKKLAASALGEYRTSVVNNFNNPGYLDLGVGFTYTPINNLVLVFHPLNYNFIFADTESAFTSSLGCKIFGSYNAEIYKGIQWKSNLTGFYSYKNNDPSLHNGTWTNEFAFNIFNGIGVGITHGLRVSPQERALLGVSDKLQSFYILGLSYAL